MCSQEGVGAGDEDGVVDGDFAVGDAEDGGWVLGCYMSGYAGVPACFQGGAVSRPHHSFPVSAGVLACCKVSLSGAPEKSLIFGVDFGRFRGSC